MNGRSPKIKPQVKTPAGRTPLQRLPWGRGETYGGSAGSAGGECREVCVRCTNWTCAEDSFHIQRDARVEMMVLRLIGETMFQ